MKRSSFKDLAVWHKSMELTLLVYSLIRNLPKEETYALSDQLRRAVVSIPSNIAEGHGRGSDRDFVHFLVIARGSLYEVETQIEICFRLQYIQLEYYEKVRDLISEVSKMLNALISYRLNLMPNA